MEADRQRATTTASIPELKFIVLHEGKIVFDGNTEELVHTEDPWLKEYLA